ncbi:hypothetical protein BSNK01_17560 [Bacillaceae bacterium]
MIIALGQSLSTCRESWGGKLKGWNDRCRRHGDIVTASSVQVRGDKYDQAVPVRTTYEISAYYIRGARKGAMKGNAKGVDFGERMPYTQRRIVSD